MLVVGLDGRDALATPLHDGRRLGGCRLLVVDQVLHLHFEALDDLLALAAPQQDGGAEQEVEHPRRAGVRRGRQCGLKTHSASRTRDTGESYCLLVGDRTHTGGAAAATAPAARLRSADITNQQVREVPDAGLPACPTTMMLSFSSLAYLSLRAEQHRPPSSCVSELCCHAGGGGQQMHACAARERGEKACVHDFAFMPSSARPPPPSPAFSKLEFPL